ncbi:phosphatase PAP2 family protein [Piscinibacter sp.]|uniref:phosphatase PAP2 family protein n=1 Tax=Piscinibacter sp. TaxID=1903157 RepID=UPI0039E5BF76
MPERRTTPFGLDKWFFCFLAGLLVGGFIILTSEVREALAGEKELIGLIDQTLLALAVEHRTPALNGVAVDITALGSAAGLSILIGFVCLFFLLGGRRTAVAHMLLAAAGAAGLTAALKFYFERSRPDVSLRLVDVQGFSYPSGHSLASAAIYFTCAILVTKPFGEQPRRWLLWAFFLALIAAIGFTRIYLGVHFFSDVVAGIMLGIAWASLVEFGMNRWNTRT